MYNEEGETTWQRSLDSNGNVKTGNNSSCPFLYQGQYYDEEIELAYNRFRYYDPQDGRYISQDPIGLHSGEYGFYNYVGDSNKEIDGFGLEPRAGINSYIGDALHPKTVTVDNPGGVYTITPTGSYYHDKIALYGEAKLSEGFDPSKWISHHVSYDPNTKY